jgi:class 3 adenylate cyclase
MVQSRMRISLARSQRMIWLRPMLVCSALCVFTCLAIAFAQMRAGQAALLSEYRERVKVMADLGGRVLSKNAALELWRQSTPDLPASKVADIERSPAYREIWDELHGIQQIDHDLIRYVYVLRSFEHGDPRFLADADVLRPNPPSHISHFNDTYPLDAVPHLRDALQTCELQWEQDFVPDDEYGVRSLSAYAPIHLDGMPAGTCVVLGVDMVDDDALSMHTWSGIRTWGNALLLTILLLVPANMVVLRLTRSWAHAWQRVRRLARTYCGLDGLVARRTLQQLNMDLDALDLFCGNRGDDMVRRYVASIFASRSTAERVRNDVVPDLAVGVCRQGAGDEITQHDRAVVLVATLAGLRKIGSGQTEQALTAWHSVFEEYCQLARKHDVLHATTTGSCFLAVATTASQPGAVASIVALARDMIASTRRHADRARFPLCAAVGIDVGPIALRVDNESKRLVDLWGDVAVDARLLQQSAPAHGIQISARVSALIDDTEVRQEVHQANGESTFVIVGDPAKEKGAT